MDIANFPDLAEIRLVRQKLGWTQRKLAQSTGLSQSYINKIERNESDPGYRTAKQIFKVLAEATKKERNQDKKTASDFMTALVESVSSSTKLAKAIDIMLKNDYSQLPVIDNGIVKGSITDRLLVSLDNSSMEGKVGDIMAKGFPIVDSDARIEVLQRLLEEYPAVLVNTGDKNYGIVTKHDLIKALKRH